MEKTSIIRFGLMLLTLVAVQLGTVSLMSTIGQSLQLPDAWQSFAPDLLVGAITTLGLGLVLALVVGRIEQNAQDRALAVARQRGTEDGWSALRRRSALVLLYGTFSFTPSSASDLGSMPRDLVALTAREPLREWKVILRDDEVGVLEDTCSAAEITLMQGERLDLVLQSVLTGMSVANWKECSTLVRAVAQRQRVAEVSRYWGFAPSAAHYWVIKNAARDYPALRIAFMNYRGSVDQLRQKLLLSERALKKYGPSGP